MTESRYRPCSWKVDGQPCCKPALPGGNPFCQQHDLEMLIFAREWFPDAADEDFEREVPRG